MTQVSQGSTPSASPSPAANAAPNASSSVVDRTERTGSPGMVLVLALVLVGTAASFSFLSPEDAGRLTLGLLALLAIIGVIGLFAYAVGFLQLSGQAAKNDITKLVSDTGVEGMLVTEGDTRVLYANEAYMALAGANDLADLRTVERLFSGTPEVSEAIYRLAQAARDGKRGSEELRLSPPLSGEGAVGWYRIRVRPLERFGQKRATLWTVADVTRERARHENVFQELQHAIDFLDHAPAGFFSCGADGKINYMNATLAGWLDYDLAQYGSGGLRLADIVAGDGAHLIGTVAGRASEVRTETFDVDFKRRNGQSLPVRVIHRVAFAQDRTQGPSRTLVINRAPGEEPAENLRAAEVRFARFFNQTPMAIATVDRDGAILNANASFARLMPQAVSGATDTGRSIFSSVVDRDRETLRKAIADALAHRTDTEPVDAGLGGEPPRSARFFVTPGEDSNDDASAVIFALDTTEQKTLQESFAQAQKMQAIGQLAGGVAHDFNNILTAIIGHCDLMLMRHSPGDSDYDDIQQIRANSNRAASLTRQLLAFSRQQTLRPQVLQLPDIISEVSNLLKRLLGETVSLDVKHGRNLGPVRADPGQLEQVVVNLAVNARDAMLSKNPSGGGSLTIETLAVSAAEVRRMDDDVLPVGDYTALRISDTGTGIPPEILPKIWEPFFTTKEVGKGTGLGLSTVYGIIKQSGGYIFAENVPGAGAAFTIYLPVHAAPEAAVAKLPVTKDKPADLWGTGTILVVEDEDMVRAIAERALSRQGYSVVTAENGEVALETIETMDKPDLLVSDVVMPVMDGPSMARKVRERWPDLPILFMSGYAEEQLRRSIDLDNVAFLPKPFSVQQLAEAVQEILAAK